MPLTDDDQSSGDQVTATWVEFTIRLGVLGLLLYFSFLLVRPFISIATWSVVLTVALYPVYNLIVGMLGGRRRLAAALLTLLSLLIVIGPATWLVLGLIDSFRIVSERLDLSALALPPPRETVKNWPLIGDQIYEVWELASNNIEAALAKVAPLLKPIGSSLIQVAAGAGTGPSSSFSLLSLQDSYIRRHPRWWMPSKNSHAGSTMETTSALLFTAYMIPVSILDNVLRPLIMGRGLETPILIILIGVIGGTVSFGITGLFLGPIVLAVIWELLVAWSKEHGSA
jgi:predicted PurR-regulated permease PerM